VSNRITRRMVAAAIVAGVGVLMTSAIIVSMGAGAAAVKNSRGWMATWAASPMGGGSTQFGNQTVRNIIYTSAGGTQVRVRLSNTFGSRPVEVGATSPGCRARWSKTCPRYHPLGDLRRLRLGDDSRR
jgi:hypothetical protein